MDHCWLLADAPVVPWVDDPEQLVADAIEAMARRLDESHERVMLVDE